MGDRKAVLVAQGISESDLKRNRAGKLSEQQRVDLLGNEATGMWIMCVLAVAMGVGIPLVVARDSTTVWAISVAITAGWLTPILILQLLYRRRVLRGNVTAVDGVIESVTRWRGSPIVTLNGKRYPIRRRLAEVLAPEMHVRLYSIPGIRNTVAIEPVE